MKLLAIDTSSHVCSACVFDKETRSVLAKESRDIGRGHAEVLMALIEGCLSQSKTDYQDLYRIGVTIGPGSFTGVRVGMSVARGLGLSLDIPVVGISTLEACEATAKEMGQEANLVSLLDAKRGELYCMISDNKPFASSYKDIEATIAGTQVSLCGAGAEILNKHCQTDFPVIHSDASFDIGLIADLSVAKPQPENLPEPLYLRSADAKVQAGFALERLKDSA